MLVYFASLMIILMYFLYCSFFCIYFFFFNDTATTEIYTLSLHDALPIYRLEAFYDNPNALRDYFRDIGRMVLAKHRSEERFSRNAETDLVCRLLLEKKKKEVRIVETIRAFPLRLLFAIRPVKAHYLHYVH